MARQSTVENLSAAGMPDASKSGSLPMARATAAPISESHLPPIATGADLLAILVRAHVLRGDTAAALHAAGRLSAVLPGRPDPVDMVIDAALDRGRTKVARTVLQLAGTGLSDPHAAAIKARISRAEGDLPAARAILVVAIERAPSHAGLRVLLTEMMVAAGTASDARAVLTHLGQAPVNPVAADQSAAPGPAGTAAGAGQKGQAEAPAATTGPVNPAVATNLTATANAQVTVASGPPQVVITTPAAANKLPPRTKRRG